MPRITTVPGGGSNGGEPSLAERYPLVSSRFHDQLAVMAHSPDCCHHLYSLVDDLNRAGHLTRRTIEIAVVTTSLVNRCQYCVDHHGALLVEHGLTRATVDTLLEERPEGLDDVDILVRDYARLVSERAWGIPEAVVDRLKTHFSERQIVDLTVRIGLCILFNKFNQALQIETEDGP